MYEIPATHLPGADPPYAAKQIARAVTVVLQRPMPPFLMQHKRRDRDVRAIGQDARKLFVDLYHRLEHGHVQAPHITRQPLLHYGHAVAQRDDQLVSRYRQGARSRQRKHLRHLPHVL